MCPGTISIPGIHKIYFMTPIMIILIAVALVVLFIIFTYNGLISARNRALEAWADIDVQLKRRYELIPNLINTVKGAANFETTTLEKVVAARNSAMAGGEMTTAQKAENENMLTSALKSVFALAESYPDLKASANFMELQRELSDTEDKIQAARRFYNSTVMTLNTMIESFPANVFAKSFGFINKDLFELNEADKKVMDKPVEVTF
jgi:LemA protein